MSGTNKQDKLLAFVFYTLLYASFPVATQTGYLFRVSQGASASQHGGLWGGQIETSADGQASNLNQYGYSDSQLNIPGVPQGMPIRGVSFDEFTQEVLTVVAGDIGSVGTGGDSSFTGIAAPLCEANKGYTQVVFSGRHRGDSSNPYLFDANCGGGKCGWGPFTYHRGNVYFILTGVFGQISSQLTYKVDLRVMSGCHQNTSDPFLNVTNILTCSTRLATIHSSRYRKPNPRVKVWASQTMRVIEKNGQLTFYLQLVDTRDVTPVMKLYQIKPSLDVHGILYSVDINERYAAGNLRIQGFGSIDVRDEFVCWTAGDRLLCAMITNDRINSAVELIFPGGARQVCTGQLPSAELENILTGVVIAEFTSTALSMYFGCYSEVVGFGGVGFITIRNHSVTRSIYPVISRGRPVYGGSLFLAQSVEPEVCMTYSTSPTTVKPVTSPRQSTTASSTNTLSSGQPQLSTDRQDLTPIGAASSHTLSIMLLISCAMLS